MIPNYFGNYTCIGERDCRKCGKHFTGTCLCLTFLCNDCYTDAENRVISPAGGSGCLPGLLNSVDLIFGRTIQNPKPTYEELAQAVKDKCFQLYDNATCSQACIYCEKEDWKDGPPHEENCIVTRLTKGKE